MVRALLVALLSLSALSATLARPQDGGSGQCNGNVLCCNGATHALSSSEGKAVAAAFGYNADNYDQSTTLVTSCGDPGIAGIGSGSSCTTNPICCQDNSFGSNNLLGVGIGCTSISIPIL